MWHCSRQEEERRRQELEAKRHEDLLRRQQQQHQQFKMAEEDPFVSSFVCTNFFVIKSLCAATTYQNKNALQYFVIIFICVSQCIPEPFLYGGFKSLFQISNPSSSSNFSRILGPDLKAYLRSPNFTNTDA